MWKKYDGTEAEAMQDEPTFEEHEEIRQRIRDFRDSSAIERNAKTLYEACKSASVGEAIKCPACNFTMVKKSYQHVFCSNKGRDNCKDTYWNFIEPSRMKRKMR